MEELNGFPEMHGLSFGDFRTDVYKHHKTELETEDEDHSWIGFAFRIASGFHTLLSGANENDDRSHHENEVSLSNHQQNAKTLHSNRRRQRRHRVHTYRHQLNDIPEATKTTHEMQKQSSTRISEVAKDDLTTPKLTTQMLKQLHSHYSDGHARVSPDPLYSNSDIINTLLHCDVTTIHQSIHLVHSSVPLSDSQLIHSHKQDLRRCRSFPLLNGEDGQCIDLQSDVEALKITTPRSLVSSGIGNDNDDRYEKTDDANVPNAAKSDDLDCNDPGHIVAIEQKCESDLDEHKLLQFDTANLQRLPSSETTTTSINSGGSFVEIAEDKRNTGQHNTEMDMDIACDDRMSESSSHVSSNASWCVVGTK